MDSSLRQVRWLLPAVLSITAGAVDVIGFISLGGLFTAHITGNLVILAAHYVTGRFAKIAPLLSVPVFYAVLGLVALAFAGRDKPRISRRALLILHASFIAAFFGLGVWLGPFPNVDSGPAVFVGMLGISAMATQNGLVRLALAGSPSTAALTTNTTQLTIDLATLVRNSAHSEELAKARRRAANIFPAVLGFLFGCAAGAYLDMKVGFFALLLPLLFAVLAIPLGELWSDAS